MEEAKFVISVYLFLDTKKKISAEIHSEANLHEIEVVELLSMPGYLRVKFTEDNYEIIKSNCVESYVIIRHN
jgi:hypothetical protein